MGPKNDSPKKNGDYLSAMDKVIETLTLQAMASGNNGNFDTAFSDMEAALWLTQSLGIKRLEAALLNNLGLLQTMKGEWDSALLTFNRSIEIVMESCPSNKRLLTILKKNISCLFDPKITTPSNPKDG